MHCSHQVLLPTHPNFSTQTAENYKENSESATGREKRRVSVDTFLIEEETSVNPKESILDPENNEKRTQQLSFHVQCLNHAQNFNGKFLNKLHKKKIFLYLCELGHKFFLTKKEIIDGHWCNTCRKTFQNLKRFSRENRGELINIRIEKNISFKCEAGHVWETTCRKAFWNWCRVCSKNTKQILKDLNKLENLRIEQDKIRRQVNSKE